jgi:hypothetical protein
MISQVRVSIYKSLGWGTVAQRSAIFPLRSAASAYISATGRHRGGRPSGRILTAGRLMFERRSGMELPNGFPGADAVE